jgi:hypothetical protein
MKAYETSMKITSEGKLELPPNITKLLPRNQMVRAIILIPEASESEEAAWERLTVEQFFNGYGEADSIYDRK